MHTLDLPDWRDHLVLTRELVTPGDRAQFYLDVERGRFVRLVTGVYIGAAQWKALDRHGRYRAVIKGVVAVDPRDLVFSHESAAALWRLPALDSWPDRVHVTTSAATGGRSNARVQRHSVSLVPNGVLIDGVTVTGLARTVVDVAATLGFPAAVVVADAALRRTTHPIVDVPRTFLTREDLWRELGEIAVRHGSARARRVIEFADGRADRPGESLSRVNMSLAGLPAPELQVELRGASGRYYPVDFWWKDFNLIGEFDGKAKYTDPEFLRGRTPEQALLDEKAREDDLRATGKRMSRWRWAVAKSPRLLRAQLLGAGLR